jgi:hypothetical protein
MNQNVAVTKGSELDAKATEDEGAPVVQETWTLVMTDKTYGDQYRLTFGRELRDKLVEDMMGGIVLGGQING